MRYEAPAVWELCWKVHRLDATLNIDSNPELRKNVWRVNNDDATILTCGGMLLSHLSNEGATLYYTHQSYSL